MSEVTGAARDAVEATRSPAYFPGVDGLRGLATTMVVLHHTANNSGGFNNATLGGWYARTEAAVPMFLVISGFVLYRPFVAAYLSDKPRPSPATYFRRRALRIYPAYLIALVFVAVIFGDYTIRSLGDWSWYGSFAYLYKFDVYRLAPIQPAWTVSVEASYYLFLPAYTWLLSKRGGSPERRMRTVVAGISGLLVAGVVWKLLSYSLLTDAKDHVEWLVRWLPGWIDLLAIGMLIATAEVAASQGLLRLPRFLQSPRLPAVSWGAAFALYALLSTSLGLPTNRFDYTQSEYFVVHYVAGLFALLLILPAVFGPQDRGLVRHFLTSKPVAFAGTVSYGIYLWHMFFIARFYEIFDVKVFSGSLPQLFTFTMAGAVGAATLSYYLVERPTQRLGRPRTART